jgi:hypothetical protein
LPFFGNTTPVSSASNFSSVLGDYGITEPV